MLIKIEGELAAMLPDDPEKLVNRLLAAYFFNRFVPESDILSIVSVGKVLKKSHFEREEIFDIVTRQFKGLTIESLSESIFIPSETLADALQENTTIAILKSPRASGISLVPTEATFCKAPLAEMA